MCIIGIMVEYYTEAFVLGKSDFREADGIVHLYTEELGKVSARARGLKKTLSKSNAHLEPFNFAQVRLMEMKSGQYQIIDVLPHGDISTRHAKKDQKKYGVLLAMAECIDTMAYELHPDQYLWNIIKRIPQFDIDIATMHRFLLKAFGFDPQYATCMACGSGSPSHFIRDDHAFACGQCASKMRPDGVILI